MTQYSKEKHTSKQPYKELIILACTAITVFATLNCSNKVNLYDLQEVSIAANYEYNPHYEELWSDYIDTQRFLNILDYWGLEEAATTKEIAEVLAEDFYDDFVHNYMCFDEE